MLRYWFVILGMFGSLTVAAQSKTTHIPAATGKYMISDHTTPAQAKEHALREAREEALRLAGVPVEIVSMTDWLKSEVNNTYEDIYTSAIHEEVQGGIENYTITRDTTYRENDYFVREIVISADVRVYHQRRDPGFTFHVQGIKKVYENGENIQFTVKTPDKESYMTFFWISGNEVALFFPVGDENSKLEKNSTYHFPLKSSHVDYKTVKSPGVEYETNKLLLVFTKDKIPCFNYDMTLQELMTWIQKIDHDKRAEAGTVITIR